jgi:hypothetical protein
LNIDESHISYRPFAKVSQSQAERAFLIPSITPKALIQEPGECYIPFDLHETKKEEVPFLETKKEEVPFLSKKQLDLMNMTSLLKNTL